MKHNAWTLALISAGLVSVPAVTQAEESTNAVPMVLTALSATTLSGYVDTSAQWNPGTGNGTLPPIAPNGLPGGTKADGFNFNLLNLTINHPAGEGAWGAGYNASLLVGPDAAGYNNFSGQGDVSIKDAYVDLHAPLGNGLSVKLGTFTEILGYEVYETGNNPNYTRSYGYMLEPTAMTGMLAAYTVSPELSLNFGIANVWSAGLNSRNFFAADTGATGNHAESYKTYMGSFTFTSPKETGFLAGSTLSGGIISGYDAVNQVDKISWYIGGTFATPVNNLKVGVAYDYVNLADNVIGGGAHSSGYQQAVGGYLSYQATEKIGLYTRAEYLDQSGYLADALVTAGFGLPKRAVEITQTVQYDLWKNVLARAEFRWDHDATDSKTYSSGLDNVFIVAANLVYKF